MAIVLDGTTGITSPAENVSGTVTGNAFVGNGSGLTSITAATATTATNLSGGTVSATTIAASSTTKLGMTQSPTSFSTIMKSPVVIAGTTGDSDGAPYTYKVSTGYGSASASQQTILQITVPAASHNIFIKGMYNGTRNYVVGASGGTAKVGEFYMMIQRGGSGYNVVLDGNLGAKNWEATTSEAQTGGFAKIACAPTLSRAGAEANTAPQVVNITMVPGSTGSNTGIIWCDWEILSMANTITVTAIG